MLQPCLKHWMILIHIYPLDQLLCTEYALEEASGKTILIQHILWYCAYWHFYHILRINQIFPFMWLIPQMWQAPRLDRTCLRILTFSLWNVCIFNLRGCVHIIRQSTDSINCKPRFQSIGQSKGRQRRLQVVVREQLGPQLGNKAMMEWGVPKGSVAELVGQHAFCADDEGSNLSRGTCNISKWMLVSLGSWMITSFCCPVIFVFLEI